MSADTRFMRRAFDLAVQAIGETSPNPMVGCVIVKGGRVVAEGYHLRVGSAHAEVMALDRAGAKARGATMYVTLEPCTVTGRTPPCAPLVREAGIVRVVAAMRDPNPGVDGRGFRLLRRAGVRVTAGVLENDAQRLNERFVVAQTKRRPFVLLKAATTLDGRIATAGGESKWITSPVQRRAARHLRRLYDAVIVGAGTVLADDPLLLPSPGLGRPFFRVVLDSRASLPVNSRLARSAAASPVILLATRCSAAKSRELQKRGVHVLCGPAGPGGVSLRWAMKTLFSLGISSVMVEGGAEVLGSFLRARLLDKVTLFRAPVLLGGRGSRGAFGGPDPARLAHALRLSPAAPSWVDAAELGCAPEEVSAQHWYLPPATR